MLMRHPEYHFGQSDAVKDVVIGAADGLTASTARGIRGDRPSGTDGTSGRAALGGCAAWRWPPGC